MHVPAQAATRVCNIVVLKTLCDVRFLTSRRFVLKTKEQRAAEKAMMDKSPLKTLTLEDFLESERHKLTGKLTPVTPETFAKWKSERMEKKEATKQAMEKKEATGRAMFETGNWKLGLDDEEEGDDDDNDAWNLEKLRQETEAIRERKEAERIAAAGGSVYIPPTENTAADTGDGAEQPTAEASA